MNEGRLGIVVAAFSCWPGAYRMVGFFLFKDSTEAGVEPEAWAVSEGDVAVEEGSDEMKAILFFEM